MQHAAVVTLVRTTDRTALANRIEILDDARVGRPEPRRMQHRHVPARMHALVGLGATLLHATVATLLTQRVSGNGDCGPVALN
jgi:hypothetical protein